MKPATMPLIVILLVAGMSFICVSATGAGLILPLSQPFFVPDTIPKAATKLKPVKPQIDTIGRRGSGAGGSVIPSVTQMKEEFASDSTEAEYPGGILAWYKFLNKNLRLLKDSSGNQIRGEVVVQFVVDEAGNVTDVKAISGSEPLSTEALRVIKKSDKWTPGRQMPGGRCIKSIKKQPIKFGGTEE
jgi:protein TonB